MTLRISIVGAGVMGRHHARVFSALPRVVVANVVDVDAAAARALATRVGARACSFEDALATADAIVVATPIETHASLALCALEAGLHALVEKPLATSLEAGRAIGTLGASLERVVGVGHSERFNPAVRALRAATMDDPIVRLSTVRIGNQRRAQRGSLMLNLGVHDLDLARHLARSPVRLSSSQGSQEHAQLSTASAERPFGLHEVAQSAQERRRALVAFTESGVRYEADLLAGTLLRDGVPVSVEPDEPLAAQARAFVATVLDGDATELANAEAGASAVGLALEADAGLGALQGVSGSPP